MTYSVHRDGRNVGTYSEEGLARQLSTGTILLTDLVFLEKEQKWVPIAELPKRDEDQIAEFHQKVELATPTALITPALIAVNVAVYIAMAIAGVSLLDPATVDLIRWGADFGPLTTNGQWWRLLSAAFVHVGLLHLAFNMWALFVGGIFVERLFGHVGFLTVYLLSASGGNLASVAWKPLTAAAGASGAIFGLYGALLGLVIAQGKSIPKAPARLLRNNALVFIGYNIVYGLNVTAHIDMAAHVGGLVTGLFAGYGLAYRGDFRIASARLQRILSITVLGLALFSVIAWNLSARNPRQAEAFLAEVTGKSIVIGKNDKIIYSGMATVSDARRLGQALTMMGVFRDQEAAVLFTRNESGSTVSLFVKEDGWRKTALSSQWDVLGWGLSAATTTPLKLRLLNKGREVKLERVFDPKKLGFTVQGVLQKTENRARLGTGRDPEGSESALGESDAQIQNRYSYPMPCAWAVHVCRRKTALGVHERCFHGPIESPGTY